MTLSVHRRIADIARAEPGRTALIGFDADLAEQTMSWGELAGSVDDAVAALRAAWSKSSGRRRTSSTGGSWSFEDTNNGVPERVSNRP
ncbi:hypothetical protein K7G98_39090, partial [Saccharothrix sp. MB29]|nr:hypothetical protein [Saccharothrix sp. MB29]